MVYVKSIDGNALMPTSNAKARKLLKQKKAKVVSLRPFVIKLTKELSEKPTPSGVGWIASPGVKKIKPQLPTFNVGSNGQYTMFNLI